jgi:hypothetical protein
MTELLVALSLFGVIVVVIGAIIFAAEEQS